MFVRNKIRIICTGRTSEPDRTIEAASRLKQDDVIIYTAGIGNWYSHYELSNVASQPSYVFNTTNYDTLENLQGPLGSATCEGKYNLGYLKRLTLQMKCRRFKPRH